MILREGSGGHGRKLWKKKGKIEISSGKGVKNMGKKNIGMSVGIL